MNVIHFPQFSRDVVSPFDMRQLVQALELRFQTLESDSANITEGEFAEVGHTHSASEITDLDLTPDLTASSIFDLVDVTGSPINGQTLVWNGSEFVPGSQASVLSLNDLNDVAVPAPSDGDVLGFSSLSGQWEPVELPDQFVFNAAGLQAYDILWYDLDQGEWRPSAGEMSWNADLNYLQFLNAVGIRWLDSGGMSTELLTMTSANVFTLGDVGYSLRLDGTVLSLEAATRIDIPNNIGVNWDDGDGSPVELLIYNIANINLDVGAILATQIDFEDGVGGNSGSGSDIFIESGSGSLTNTSAFAGNFCGASTSGTAENQALRINDDTGGDDLFDVENAATFTAEFYWNPDETAGQNRLMQGYNASNLSCGWYVQYISGAVSLWTDTSQRIVSTGINFNDGGYHHIAVVKHSGEIIELFCDGLSQGTFNHTSVSWGTAGPVSYLRFLGFHQGRIDNIRIIKNQDLYSSGNFTPPTSLSTPTFTIGDPSSSNVIDGVLTTITGNTQLDGLLDVDGLATLNDGAYLYNADVADTTTPILTLDTGEPNTSRRLINLWENSEHGFYLQYDGVGNSPDNRLVWSSDKPSAAAETIWFGERGQVRIPNDLSGQVGLATDTHPFQIGLDNTFNLRFDSQDIQAVLNGAAGSLNLNPLGGDVDLFLNDASGSNDFFAYIGGGIFALRGVGANDFAQTRIISSELVHIAGLTMTNVVWQGYDRADFEMPLRIANGADYAQGTHDGVDFSWSHVNTGDVAFSGASREYTFDRGVIIGSFTDATRPTAGRAGRQIFNPDDSLPNFDDGLNWRLPDGSFATKGATGTVAIDTITANGVVNIIVSAGGSPSIDEITASGTATLV